MPLTGKELAKLAKENGWYEIRVKGSITISERMVFLR